MLDVQLALQLHAHMYKGCLRPQTSRQQKQYDCPPGQQTGWPVHSGTTRTALAAASCMPGSAQGSSSQPGLGAVVLQQELVDEWEHLCLNPLAHEDVKVTWVLAGNSTAQARQQHKNQGPCAEAFQPKQRCAACHVASPRPQHEPAQYPAQWPARYIHMSTKATHKTLPTSHRSGHRSHWPVPNRCTACPATPTSAHMQGRHSMQAALCLFSCDKKGHTPQVHKHTETLARAWVTLCNSPEPLLPHEEVCV